MMFDRSINKVILVGNLGKDPETRYIASGSSVTKLTLATAESWKDKVSGEHQNKTEWHKLIVFNHLGGMCSKYLKKGNKVYVEGKLNSRKWQGNDGRDHYITDIMVSQIELLNLKFKNTFNVYGSSIIESNINEQHNVKSILPIYDIKPSKINKTEYVVLDFDDDITF